MQDTVLAQAAKLNKQQRRKKLWRRAVSAMAAVVVFCTTYALILPAITMEGETFCGMEEHVHGDSCYVTETVPEQRLLTCAVTDPVVHTHGETCYDSSGELVCALAELAPHAHTDECYTETPVLTCGLEEGAEHTHGEECYAAVRELSCGFDENGIHTHTEACYGSGGELVCALSPVGVHVHGEECFTVEPARELRVKVCELTEHSHSLICHSDPEADVETAAAWEAALEGVELTGVWAEDLLAVAETQLGYAESEDNYAVCPDGATKKGYTRYGAWYGDHYGDWCAMFVSFCLNYADIPAEAFPREAGCQTWINKLSEMGAYAGAEGYLPVPGDLIFFETNGNGIADHVAIVTGTDENGAVCYIEGNSAVNNVRRGRAEPGDGTVVGYGILPENPELPRDCTKTEHTHSESCYTEVTVAGYTELICPECSGEVSGVLFHTHGELCFDGNGGLICPLEELEPHVHGEECFDGEGVLVCELEELAEHVHTEECFDENGGLICALEQTARHVHGPECVLTVPEYSELICTCGLEEHTHDGSCFPSQTEDDGELKLPEDVPLEELTDISEGPAVFVFAGVIPEQSADESDAAGAAFALRSAGTDVGEYLSANGGSLLFTLTDTENSEPEKDGAGNYAVSSETRYKLSVCILNENGFAPGTYYLALPQGLAVEGGSGMLALSDGTELGSWSVDGDGLITLSFNESVNGLSDVVISITVGMSFEEPGASVDFGGQFTAAVAPAAETESSGGSSAEESEEPSAESSEASSGAVSEETEPESSVSPGIEKSGQFLAPDGAFSWEITVTVPGRTGDELPVCWSISDIMELVDGEKTVIGYTGNTVDSASVSVSCGGSLYSVPNVADATEADLFAWVSSDIRDNGEGTVTGRQIDLLCRCGCAEGACANWENGACGEAFLLADGTDSGFCRCWTAEDAVFTIEYETDDPELVTLFGGEENLLFNRAALICAEKNVGGEWVTSEVSSDSVYVPVPGVFKKELTSEYDGSSAGYTLTLNGSKLPLGESGPITVRDIMTGTLTYISGSLVITAEDGEGNTVTLAEGTDHTVSYDGSGEVTDENGAPVHTLDIVITEPRDVKYVLTYRTALVVPEDTVEPVSYANSASVTLWGKEFTSSVGERLYGSVSAEANVFSVEILKTDSATGEPLSGAVFGLYNSQGGLVAQRTTDGSGTAVFETDVANGVILSEHELYHVCEISAPDGYVADYTEYHFCFCGDGADACADCEAVLGDSGGFRVLSGTAGAVEIANDPEVYTLPATGGRGTALYILGGAALMCVALMTPVYIGIKCRRREK